MPFWDTLLLGVYVMKSTIARASSGSVRPVHRDWREMRRLRVLALFRKQWPQIKIAEALGITKGYVSQLVKRFRDVPEAEQADTLRIENHAGRKARITPEQTRAILSLVDGGAEAFGFPGNAWTLKKLCQTIQQELDVTVGKSWLSALLHQRGYSCQKPETRAVERNDFAAAGFKGGGWAALKRGH